MMERIEKPWLFLQWLWGCRYFWYALAFMPSLMVPILTLDVVGFLEYSRDYPLGWSKYGWGLAAKHNYVISGIFWDIYCAIILFGIYIFKKGLLNVLARVLLLGLWGCIVLNVGRDI